MPRLSPTSRSSKSDERRSRSSKGDERLSKMGGSLVFKMGGSWAQRASATEPETGLTSVQKIAPYVDTEHPLFGVNRVFDRAAPA